MPERSSLSGKEKGCSGRGSPGEGNRKTKTFQCLEKGEKETKQTKRNQGDRKAKGWDCRGETGTVRETAENSNKRGYRRE